VLTILVEKRPKNRFEKEIITKRSPLTEEVTNCKDYVVAIFITNVTCVSAITNY
jgi:hypothetical protein